METAQFMLDGWCRAISEGLRERQPKELQDLLDELEASRRSRKRAWENLQEIRWVLKDAAGVELPAPARKTIDLEGGIVKDGVRKTGHEETGCAQ